MKTDVEVQASLTNMSKSCHVKHSAMSPKSYYTDIVVKAEMDSFWLGSKKRRNREIEKMITAKEEPGLVFSGREKQIAAIASTEQLGQLNKNSEKHKTLFIGLLFLICS